MKSIFGHLIFLAVLSSAAVSVSVREAFAAEQTGATVEGSDSFLSKVELGETDFLGSYSLGAIGLSSHAAATGKTYSQDGTPGGFAKLQGTFWLKNADWGARLSGSWGGFVVNGLTETPSELQMAAIWRHWEFFKSFLGVRSWTVSNLYYGGNNFASIGPSENFTISTSILFGPLVGFDLEFPLSSRLNFFSEFQASAPVTFSTTQTANEGIPPDFYINTRAEAGLKLSLSDASSLVGTVGYEDDSFIRNPSPFMGDDDVTSYYGPRFSLGYEYRDQPQTQTGASRLFSQIIMKAYYQAGMAGYAADLSENSPVSHTNYSGNFSGEGKISREAWFNDSVHGIYLAGALSGINVSGVTYSFISYWLQWGWRPFPALPGFRNFLGAHFWSLPIIFGQPNSSTVTTNPSLIGPVETLSYTFNLPKAWQVEWLGEVSIPLGMTDNSLLTTQLTPSFMTYRTQLLIEKELNPKFLAGFVLSYEVQQLQYGVVNVNTDTTVSLIQPSIGLAGTYRL